MKFCQPHWDILRAEVRTQGLGDWIATSGEVAVEQAADSLVRGEHTRVNYDPLMAAHNMIFGRVLEGLGLVVMSADFGCPICFLNERRDENGFCTCGHPECPNGPGGTALPDFEAWLTGPNSAVLACKDYMVEQGWLK